MGGQMKSRAEASMQRIVERVTKEAKARMERKPSGANKCLSNGGKEDVAGRPAWCLPYHS